MYFYCRFFVFVFYLWCVATIKSKIMNNNFFYLIPENRYYLDELTEQEKNELFNLNWFKQ